VVQAVLDLRGGDRAGQPAPRDCPAIAPCPGCPSPAANSPLRVGLVVFVTFVLDHAVPPDADVGPRHLHAVQGDAGDREQRGGSACGHQGGTSPSPETSRVSPQPRLSRDGFNKAVPSHAE